MTVYLRKLPAQEVTEEGIARGDYVFNGNYAGYSIYYNNATGVRFLATAGVSLTVGSYKPYYPDYPGIGVYYSDYGYSYESGGHVIDIVVLEPYYYDYYITHGYLPEAGWKSEHEPGEPLVDPLTGEPLQVPMEHGKEAIHETITRKDLDNIVKEMYSVGTRRADGTARTIEAKSKACDPKGIGRVYNAEKAMVMVVGAATATKKLLGYHQERDWRWLTAAAYIALEWWLFAGLVEFVPTDQAIPTEDNISEWMANNPPPQFTILDEGPRM